MPLPLESRHGPATIEFLGGWRNALPVRDTRFAKILLKNIFTTARPQPFNPVMKMIEPLSIISF